MRRVLPLVRKELAQVFRNKVLLFEMTFMPALQLLVLANAMSFTIEETRVHVIDRDRSSVSRSLVARLDASRYFEVSQDSFDIDQANEDLLTRDASMILQIPAGLEKDLGRSGSGEIQVILNAEDGAAAAIIGTYVRQIVQQHSSEIMPRLFEAGPRGEIPELPIDIQTQSWFNPTLDYHDYMVPGLLALIVTFVGTLLSAMNIAREKEMGTLEQLNVTPISKGEFIAGKLIPFWLLALVELALGLVIAKLVYDIPIEGSLLLLFAMAGVYLVAALGTGLWVSAITETQQQAMFVAFFIMVIYMLMSGLFTPVTSMPDWVQLVVELNPVKHFVAVVRAILIRGAGFAELQQPFWILVAWSAAIFTLAVRQYRKRAA